MIHYRHLLTTGAILASLLGAMAALFFAAAAWAQSGPNGGISGPSGPVYFSGSNIIYPSVVINSNSTVDAGSNAAAINAAIQTLGAGGGGIVLLPCGPVYVGATLDNDVANVLVDGCGGPSNNSDQFVGPYNSPATEIIPTFAGVALKHRTPYGGATAPENLGGGFQFLTVVDNGLATTLLDVDSISGGTYNLTLDGSTATYLAYFTSCVSYADLTGKCDVQNASIYLRLVTGSNSTHPFVATGSSNADFSLNQNMTLIIRNNGTNPGAEFVSADGNTGIAVYCASSAGPCVQMDGATTTNTVGGSHNTFAMLSGGSQSVAQGTDTSGVTTGVTNVIYNLDNANSTPIPSAGTGSGWAYSLDYNSAGVTQLAYGQFLSAKGSAAIPGYSFQGDTTTGFYDASGGSNIAISIGGVYSGGFSTASAAFAGSAYPYVVQFGNSEPCIAATNITSQRFNAYNSASATKIFAYFNVLTNTCTSGSENGELDLGLVSAGSYGVPFEFKPTSLTIDANLAVPAGGTGGAGLLFSTTANLGVFFGSGAPTLSAAQGSLYIRTDGSSTSTRLYVNTNGTTGWTYMVTGG